jgi:hypothetical protein
MLSHSEGVLIDDLPNRLVYKMSYPIKGQSQEGLLLSRGFKQFGIANVLGFHSCGPEDPHGSTEPFFKSAIFWNIFEDSCPEGGHYKPEERGLQCLALSSEGQSLLDLSNEEGGTPSPGELLETILHAIIGEYVSLCIPLYSHAF